MFSVCCVAAQSSTCKKSVKVTGFTQVKSEKSYFYTRPNTKKKIKSYLVTRDFVQVLGQPEGPYSCVLYRNFNGYGGKQTLGWILQETLEPIRRKLERRDLHAIWNKSPCFDDSCTIEITEMSGKPEIKLMSYIHDRPGSNYQVGSVQEFDGRLVLTHVEGSARAPKQMEIVFDQTVEPGAISLSGFEGWAGIYHR